MASLCSSENDEFRLRELCKSERKHESLRVHDRSVVESTINWSKQQNLWERTVDVLTVTLSKFYCHQYLCENSANWVEQARSFLFILYDLQFKPKLQACSSENTWLNIQIKYLFKYCPCMAVIITACRERNFEECLSECTPSFIQYIVLKAVY